jgi:hypothetical protein
MAFLVPSVGEMPIFALELHDSRRVVLHTGTPSVVRDAVNVSQSEVFVDISDQFLARKTNGRNSTIEREIGIDAGSSGGLQQSRMYDEQAGIDRCRKVSLSINQMKRSPPHVQPVKPGVTQQLPGGGRLAEHCHATGPPMQGFQ